MKHSHTEMGLVFIVKYESNFFSACRHPFFTTLKRGCDLTDVLATSRFALLVKSLQWKRKIQCRKCCRRMLTLFELFGAAFPFTWCRNGVSTRLF